MTLVNTENRSQDVQDVAARFELGSIVHPDARQIAIAFGRLAQELVYRIRGDADKEGRLAVTLEKLVESRDQAILAVLPPSRRPQFQEEPEQEEKEEPPVRKTTPRPRNKATATTVS